MKNSLYNLIGAVIRLVAGLLTIPVLIRTMGLEEYGLWTLVSSALNVVILAEGGLAISTTVFVSRDLANKDEEGLSQTLTVVFGAMTLLALAAAFLMWLGADLMVNSFPSLQDAQKVTALRAIQISTIVLVTKLLQQVMVGVEQSHQQYGWMNFVNTSQFLFTNIGLLAVGYVGGKSIELMQWTALISACTLGVHGVLCWRLLKSYQLRIAWNQDKSKEIGKYSMLNWVSQLGGTMFTQGDRLVIGGVLGTKVLGLYAAMVNITVQINYLAGLFVQPLLPTIAHNYQEIKSQGGDNRRLLDNVKWGFKLNAAIALGTGIVILALIPAIGRMIIGDDFSDRDIIPFQLATIIYALYSLNGAGYFTLMAIDDVKICTIFQLVSGAISLGLIYLGGMKLGLIGAILGNSGFALTLGLNSIAVYKIVKVSSLWMRWIAFPLALFLLSATITHLLSAHNFLLNLLPTSIILTIFGSYFYREFKYQKSSVA
jgi:O-antigen/teichoic acid export membrane protein